MEQHNTNNQQWMNYTVDVIIPIYRADDKFDKLLKKLYQQTIKPNKVFILHTEEYQGQTQVLPEIPGNNINVIPIDKLTFDHGGTRKYGASLSNADVLMFMTQDAIPDDEYLIENLLKPYQDPLVSATYARQLANNTASLIERFTRYFNYPKNSRVTSAADINELGIKTFFCSDVCATYRSEIFNELGGFVEKTIFNEDMIMGFRMIHSGYQIAYAAEAKVLHSHHYTYMQQFTRNFDLGVSHKQYADLFESIKSESEGMKLVNQTLNYLITKKKYWLIPDLIFTSGFKFMGYQLGKRYNILPKKLVLKCSMNKTYW